MLLLDWIFEDFAMWLTPYVGEAGALAIIIAGAYAVCGALAVAGATLTSGGAAC